MLNEINDNNFNEINNNIKNKLLLKLYKNNNIVSINTFKNAVKNLDYKEIDNMENDNIFDTNLSSKTNSDIYNPIK